jgi:AcrR family transcriptional regulator
MPDATPSLAVQLREKRSEMMLTEVEAVALGLFEEHGFANVTVDDIAAAAHISPRTFYRYFPTKDDVLQLRIAKRTEALRAALADRPADEPPLQTLRIALTEVVATEDTESMRRWIAVVASSPSLVRSVLGGITLNTQVAVAEFFAARLDLPNRALVPTMLAAAVGGVVQATQTHWYFEGGDLPAMMSESLAVLEHGIGTDPGAWSSPTSIARPRNGTPHTKRSSTRAHH